MTLGVPDLGFGLALRTPPPRALAKHVDLRRRGPAHERRNSRYFKPVVGTLSNRPEI